MASTEQTNSNPATSMNSEIIPLSTTTHLPTKLIETNFNVWKKQLETTLYGYNLLGFITGDLPWPKSTTDTSTSNPEYFLWNKQDQFILSAMLGSYTETIQPIISTATYSKEASQRLQTMYAKKSRTRVLSLKYSLMQNPKGTRSINEYIKDMRSIADALVLANSPISDKDLFLQIKSQHGPGYENITYALHARDTPITFDSLYDKLKAVENQIAKDSKISNLV